MTIIIIIIILLIIIITIKIIIRQTRGHWPKELAILVIFAVQSDPKMGSMRPWFNTPIELVPASVKNKFHPNPLVTFKRK